MALPAAKLSQYKVRLKSGRVLGPLTIERIQLFVNKGVITGDAEQVCVLPQHDFVAFCDVPELAALVAEPESLSRLVADQGSLQLDPTHQAYSEFTHENRNSPSPEANDDATKEESLTKNDDPKATVILTLPPRSQEPEPPVASRLEAPVVLEGQFNNQIALSIQTPVVAEPEVDYVPSPSPIFQSEPTAMFTVGGQPLSPDAAPSKASIVDRFKAANSKQKIFIAIAVLAAVFYLLAPEEPKKVIEPPFQVELPVMQSPDPQLAEKAFREALGFYNQDTVPGYKRAALLFKRAASYDANHVRALCMLASSYMNLFDVVNHDETYFSVITRLIEQARTKDVDFGETVLADVELYLMLGNPDAAFSRIVEYSKSHPNWGVEMLYYLATALYRKGQYTEALQQLYKIDFNTYSSPRIPYLFGLLFEKSGQLDEAAKSFQATVAKSSMHIKARLKLAEISYKQDQLNTAGHQVNFILQNTSAASKDELGMALFYRAKLHLLNNKITEAVTDLTQAVKLLPDNHDVVLEYYTVRSRDASRFKEAASKAKMFHHLALGEKALRAGLVEESIAEFLNARDADYSEVIPLIRLGEAFTKKGDLQSAKLNYEKALKVKTGATSKGQEIYPKYIKILIDLFEVEQATEALAKYRELHPPVATFDRLQGQLAMRQDKYREAQIYFKKALASQSVDSSVFILYARVLYLSHQYREAAFQYGLALRFDPLNTDAIVGVGKSLAEMESVEKGVEYISSFINLSPEKAALMNGIAELYLSKGLYDQAQKLAENALMVDAKFIPANRTRADALAARDKVKEALEAYQTYINLAPFEPIGRIKRYELFMRRNEKGEFDLRAAKYEIQQVIEGFPKYPGAYYMLGQLLFEAGDYKGAHEAASIEIKQNPFYLAAYILLGTVLNVNKDYVGALKQLTIALKLNPNNVQALIQAAIANRNLKTYAAAKMMLERAVVIDPGNPQIHKSLGFVYYDLNDFARMKASFQQYLEMYPDAQDRQSIQDYLAKVK